MAGWTTPRTWVAGEVATAAELNAHVRDNTTFLKSGVALSTSVTANSASTSATTELVVATAPAYTADGSTLVELQFSFANITKTVSTDVFNVLLYEGTTPGAGTGLGAWTSSNAGSTTGGAGARVLLTPSAGAHTYTARLVRLSGTGTAILNAGSTSPAIISIAQVN